VALTLVRLKIALLRAGVRLGGMSSAVGLSIALMLGLGFGGLVGFLLAFVRVISITSATNVVAGVFSIVFFGWLLFPVLAIASDGALEPDRLALLPLSPTQLVPGLLLAAAVGVGGLFSVLVLAGAFVGLSPLSAAAVLTVLAVVAELAIWIAASRTLSTALSSAARTRRGRDIALFVGPLLGIGINLVFQLFARSSRPSTLHYTPGVGITQGKTGAHDVPHWAIALVRWLPSGWPADAMGAARRGDVLMSVGWLLTSAVFVVVLLWMWWLALRRATTTAAVSTSKPSHSAADLFPWLVRFLPRSPIGAVTAKELRYLWRDPRQRAALFGAIAASFVPMISFTTAHLSSSKITVLAVLPAFIIGASATNQFGFDASAYWTNVAAGSGARPDLLGKNIARAFVSLGLICVIVVGLASLTNGWDYLVPTMCVSAFAFAVVTGMANMTSVTAPVPMPESTTNVFSSGGLGRGTAAVGPSLLVLVVGGAIVGPFAAAIVLVPKKPIDLGVVSAIALAVGAAAWWGGLALAVKRLTGREPELLEALSARHRV
jgi:ABC-2 type transport system permease protein